MDINNYLAINTYNSDRIRSIFVIDLKNKKLYCGYHFIGQSYDPLYDDFKDSFSYYIPLKKEKLNFFMNLKTQSIIGLHVNDFFNNYDLKEWLI